MEKFDQKPKQDLLDSLFNNISLGLTVWAPDGRMLIANKGFIQLTGYRPDETGILGRWLEKVLAETGRGRRKYEQWEYASDELECVGEHDIICKDGSVKTMELRFSRLKDGRTLMIVTDITERKKSREENLKRKKFLEAVLYQAPDAVVTMDNRHRVIDWNPGAVKLFGYHPREVAGKELDDLVARESAYDEARMKTRRVMSGKKVEPFETVRYRKDGSAVRVIAGGSPIIIDGELAGVVAVYTDITDRVKAEKELKKSEARFRALIEKLPLGIILLSPDGRCLYFNPAIEKNFGFTIEKFPTIEELCLQACPDQDYRQEIIKAWKEDEGLAVRASSEPRVMTIICVDGNSKQVYTRMIAMENGERFIICEDITDKIKMEMQFHQAQKFEAIGTLAGGIAHDFNNLLTGIQGFASLVKMDMDKDHPNRQHLDAIEKYVRSATTLTGQLLGMARGGKYEVEPYDLNYLVAESAAMFSRTRKEVIVHEKYFHEELVANVDKAQIQQVLLNIFVNAWQAMPGGGQLFLETSKVVMDEGSSRLYRLKPGRYARLSITDTGTGMDEQTRKRIFDPFFTTKAKGRGTGLGLASAYGIIKNHSGCITVYSEPGKGSSFHIYLPLTARKAVEHNTAYQEPIPGSGTVLLVDDEEIILSVGRLMLEKLGYRVIAVQNGLEAIKTVEQKGEEINLVILDLIMPEMDGGAVFDKIRAICPEIPVLLSSGYSINGQARDILDRGCNGFVQKPFTVTELTEKIQSCFQKRK